MSTEHYETKPAVHRESLLVTISALPYRFLPGSLHPFMTPLALSLALWVPIAWTFAILGPTPTPGAARVLQPGFENRMIADEVEGVVDDASPAPPLDSQ